MNPLLCHPIGETAVPVAVDCDTLYLAGGLSSFDHGCPSWGSADHTRLQLVGDQAGELILTDENNVSYKIPLIFGYTMWYYTNWIDGGAPFKTEETNPDAARLLSETLCLKQAFEGQKPYLLKIDLCGKKIKSALIQSSGTTPGQPLFGGAFLRDGDCELLYGENFKPVNSSELFDEKRIESEYAVAITAEDDFFKAHTINLDDPYPVKIAENIARLRHLLYISFDEIEAATPYEKRYENRPHFRFYGTPQANIATGVFAENLNELIGKIDTDGFFHTSSFNAPSWRYDGFGTYVPNCNSYYALEYSRDAARGLMSLLLAGETGPVTAVIDRLNKALMFFKENKLTLGGQQIPGHWTVNPNRPLIYLEEHVHVGWPTQYTEEKFGPEWKNIGNHETDGHGLCLVAECLLLLVLNDKEKAESCYAYLSEAVEYIEWCLDNPALSFAKEGVLYGETEAAMNEYTLYANIPNYLGIKATLAVVEAFGISGQTERLNALIDRFEPAIDRYFKGAADDVWDFKKRGFLHDPVITMFADVYGFLPGRAMPKNWYERSLNIYREDVASVGNSSYFAPAGLGYDQNMITQFALLADQSGDYTGFVNSLMSLCYAPKQQGTYITPEGASVDLAQRIINRQGDLGNLVQQAETIKTLFITAGIFASGGEIRIAPRLPAGWNADIEDCPVYINGKKVYVSLNINREAGKTVYRIGSSEKVAAVLRAGPFDLNANTVTLTVNGASRQLNTYQSGDSRWADYAFECGDVLQITVG